MAKLFMKINLSNQYPSKAVQCLEDFTETYYYYSKYSTHFWRTFQTEYIGGIYCPNKSNKFFTVAGLWVVASPPPQWIFASRMQWNGTWSGYIGRFVDLVKRREKGRVRKNWRDPFNRPMSRLASFCYSHRRVPHLTSWIVNQSCMLVFWTPTRKRKLHWNYIVVFSLKFIILSEASQRL